MPVSEDLELAHFQDLAVAAHQRFEMLRKGFQDSDVLRYVKAIWLDARAAASEYENWHKPGDKRR